MQSVLKSWSFRLRADQQSAYYACRMPQSPPHVLKTAVRLHPKNPLFSGLLRQKALAAPGFHNLPFLSMRLPGEAKKTRKPWRLSPVSPHAGCLLGQQMYAYCPPVCLKQPEAHRVWAESRRLNSAHPETEYSDSFRAPAAPLPPSALWQSADRTRFLIF